MHLRISFSFLNGEQVKDNIKRAERVNDEPKLVLLYAIDEKFIARFLFLIFTAANVKKLLFEGLLEIIGRNKQLWGVLIGLL